MTQVKTVIDLNKLMVKTDYGRDIYEMIFPNLELLTNTQYKNVLNPFYKDTNPSLSIYKGKSWWLYKDFGDEAYSGDALDMAALYYELDRKAQFSKLLRHIVDDLKIDPELVIPKPDPCLFETGFHFDGEWRNDEEGLNTAYSYFSQYGITKDVLRQYGVRTAKYLWTLDETGNPKRQFFPKDEIAIVYEDINHTKLYRPFSDKPFKFRYLGYKPKNFIFGRSEIFTDMYAQDQSTGRGPLIITSGEKDVLTLVSLGYDAISFNSETANGSQILTDSLFRPYKKIIVLYDIDETGIKNAFNLAQKYKLALCTLPAELYTRGGKDVSDYIKLGLPIQELHNLITNSSMPPIIESSTGVTNTKQIEPETKISKPDSSVTPCLPDEVYELLPQTLKIICGKFEDKRDKDVCLLSCLTVLSSCFPSIKGIYDGRRIGCNINLFISAPASAGKGTMSWSKILGNSIHTYLKKKNEEALLEYECQIASYNANKSQGKEQEKPQAPKSQKLFIPANSSSSSVIEHLDANQHFGIIFDNEGDTLSSTMKNDWADFSSVIRKTFHHESVSMSRRGNKEFLEVENPHLSVLLSGTRNQVAKLVHSVENGLFSRFAFYDFEGKIEWKDKFGKEGDSLDDFFKMHGEELLEYWKKDEKSNETILLLDDIQRRKIHEYFEKKLGEMYEIYGEDIIGSIKRTCVIFYRIAMLLTVLRCYEIMNSKTSHLLRTMTIPTETERCAFLIVDTLITHLEFVFIRLQHTGSISRLNSKQQSLYDALPQAFSWREFVTIADKLEIKKTTAEKYRRDFLDLRLMLSKEHNRYNKA